jgi:esterase/lipase
VNRIHAKGVLSISLLLLHTTCSFVVAMQNDSSSANDLPSMVEYLPSSTKAKAVSLVVHGLNVKPSAMLDIAHWLNEQGSDVYLVRLTGHADSTNILNVTGELWDSEMLGSYEIAKRAAVAKNLPLYFVGYSLGALLGQDMVQFSNPQVTFDKQVLIAPAIGMRNRSHLVKALFFLNNKKLPSYTPVEVRANKGLPVKVYKILFQKEKRLYRSKFSRLNIPTLLVIDHDDELISERKLRRIIDQCDLTQYEFLTIKAGSQVGSPYHHLIISEATMGNENWKMVTDKIKRLLFATL